MAIIRKNKDFTMIPNRLIGLVSSGALETYIVIVQTAWGPGHEYYNGSKVLAEDRGICQRSLRMHLRELEEAGAVDVHTRGKRRNAVITVCEWSEIGDRQKTAVHIGDERQETAGHPGKKLPVQYEEDASKKMPGSPGRRKRSAPDAPDEVVGVGAEDARARDAEWRARIEASWPPPLRGVS